ncbi:MAG: enoyl-CoA hydratase/isomerase family protein [Planctomycetota bacterium]|nr:enoyl-CoA hydratase/isomerase family protein [Planctomycetota bacterium]MDP6519736.1 enoyl-CoA hydratase/isomerase family protein [Planctomycetota bacterium]MDP6837318.1 enoyl-CoA hydratase/isomerase family protein [Planctomycetota bacterium]MDP6956014.1 enoyl-CoA hydratase/isomerase family protein [Planctomycetota bacterium]
MAEALAGEVKVELLDEGKILHLVIDAGKGNIIDAALMEELGAVLNSHGSEPSLRAIILDHAGKHFSFGASVEEHAPDAVAGMLPSFHALAKRILGIHVPTLVIVRGACLGGGLEVACLGHRIFAAPSASLGQPETVLGVFAPIGTALLPRLIGRQAAADLLFSGRSVNAAEALAMGLVASVDEDPLAAALDWARTHLVPKSASSLRFAARALGVSADGETLRVLDELEALYLGELMESADAVEGIAAFMEKRNPAWKDC